MIEKQQHKLDEEFFLMAAQTFGLCIYFCNQLKCLHTHIFFLRCYSSKMYLATAER